MTEHDSYYADQRFPLLRDRDRGENSVSNIELFFDLVYVFAVAQLSHSLFQHLTLRGALETTIMMLAVWWAWIDTSWITNWFDPVTQPVRAMLISLMLLSLFMSAAIPQSFDGRGLWFATAYVLIQIGRSLFCTLALGSNEQVHNFRRILFWAVMSAPLWIAGGFADGDTRLALWIAAVALDCAAPAAGFRTPFLGKSSTAEWKISGEHLAERCQLFIIICLGESILLTGARLSNLEVDGDRFAAFLAAFLLSVAMWWVYFSRAGRGAEIFEHSDDPGSYGRAYTYFHMPMVAGIISLAVANEMIIDHPSGHTAGGVTAVTIGGAIIYMTGNALFNAALTRAAPWRRIVAIGVLAAFAPLAHLVSPVVLLYLVLAVFVGIAIADAFAMPPRVSEEAIEEEEEVLLGPA